MFKLCGAESGENVYKHGGVETRMVRMTQASKARAAPEAATGVYRYTWPTKALTQPERRVH